MWVMVAILVVVPPVSSICGRNFDLTASNPKATFEFSNFLVASSPRENDCGLVSAPQYVNKLSLDCNITISKASKTSVRSFHYYDLNRKFNISEEEKFQAVHSRAENTFTLYGLLPVESSSMDLVCTVSISPEDFAHKNIYSCKCGQKRGQRIINGKAASPNEYPWVAFIMDRNHNQLCGGALISNNWVITTTFCMKEIDISQVLVVLGEDNPFKHNSLRRIFSVKQVIKHEGYRDKIHINDIALLELQTPVTFDEFISPICLPFNYRTYNFKGKKGIMVGWGEVDIDSGVSESSSLLEIDQQLIMPLECISSSSHHYLWHHEEITEDMICGLNSKGAPCRYDWGGPLVWRNDYSNHFFLLGLMIEKDKDCTNTKKPAVYTMVSHYIDWIESKTGDIFCHKT